MLRTLSLPLLLVLASCSPHKVTEGFVAPVNTSRQQLFDEGWLFTRGNPPGAHLPDYLDSAWRSVTLPHDWSIEDFPIDSLLPLLTPGSGEWRFCAGDSDARKLPHFDDSLWERVTPPHIWSANPDWQSLGNSSRERGENRGQESLANASQESRGNRGQEKSGSYGWYRTNVVLADSAISKGVQLNLGRFSDADEVYWNGELIGSTGVMPARFQKPFAAPGEPRCYEVPASLCRKDNSLSIRVFSLSDKGGYTEPLVAKPLAVGPFTTWSQGGADTGHTFGGTGWYRKHFTIEPSDSGKLFSLLFDGIYMFSDIWVNGQKVAIHPNGYTPLHVEITSFLRPAGQENVVAVQVKNWGKNSRWYSGSGIYRHVHLLKLPVLHLPLWGISVTTPKVSDEAAIVYLTATVANRTEEQGSARLSVRILDPSGSVVAEQTDTVTYDGISQTESKLTFRITRPQLWAPGSPHLYTAELTLSRKGRTPDRTLQPFGIRSLFLSPDSGLFLNGHRIVLRGGCIHHDNGILGAAAFDRAEYRKLELLKAQGYNAVRTAHNPPSSALLDAADRLGMLVINEAFDMWREAKRPHDYHLFFNNFAQRDLASMILRDRNHPSVIMWSIGNEIPERADEEGLRLAEMLIREIHTYDISRPVTQGICDFWDRPGLQWEATAPAFALLDVQGYNYQWKRYRSDRELYPQRIIMGTESFPLEARQNWEIIQKYPYVVGDFVWTAIDYLGESGIAHADTGQSAGHGLRPWPWFNSWCGDIDLIGQKKPQSYYRDLVWGRRSIVAMVHTPQPGLLQPGSLLQRSLLQRSSRQNSPQPGSHLQGLPLQSSPEKVSPWGWPNELMSWEWPGYDGHYLEVTAYTAYPSVRFELNGKTLANLEAGRANNYKATAAIPYAPGDLLAIALTADGADADTCLLRTPGEPHSATLVPDRAIITPHHGDLCFVTVTLSDSLQQPVTSADRPITFTVSGPAEIEAVGNANPKQMQSFASPQMQSFASPQSQTFVSHQSQTFRGTCLVILRPLGKTGKVTLTAQPQGLKPTVMQLKIHN